MNAIVLLFAAFIPQLHLLAARQISGIVFRQSVQVDLVREYGYYGIAGRVSD